MLRSWRNRRRPRDGDDGADGIDVDPAELRTLVERGVRAVLAAQPAPPPIEFKAEDLPRGPKGDKGDKGDRGDKGEQGDQGEPGPMPRHRWHGTELQFERPDGDWGKRVDLRGPPGYSYAAGGAFSFDALPIGDTSTPTEIIVKQHNVWSRIGWATFLDLVGTAPAPYTPALDFSDARNSGYLSLHSIGI